jgi:NAD-dependent SIR2 family protein deacetylase
MADGKYARTNPDAVCGCHNCGRILRFKEIEDFWDEGGTPVCPGCGMDTVVIETADMEITPERLLGMRQTY